MGTLVGSDPDILGASRFGTVLHFIAPLTVKWCIWASIAPVCTTVAGISTLTVLTVRTHSARIDRTQISSCRVIGLSICTPLRARDLVVGDFCAFTPINSGVLGVLATGFTLDWG